MGCMSSYILTRVLEYDTFVLRTIVLRKGNEAKLGHPAAHPELYPPVH